LCRGSRNSPCETDRRIQSRSPRGNVTARLQISSSVYFVYVQYAYYTHSSDVQLTKYSEESGLFFGSETSMTYNVAFKWFALRTGTQLGEGADQPPNPACQHVCSADWSRKPAFGVLPISLLGALPAEAALASPSSCVLPVSNMKPDA
jgi:hypothetical protein